MNTIEKGIVLGMAIAVAFLIAAVGSASALPVCQAPGNTVITESCELNQSWTVPAGQHGYIIGADDITVDGNEYAIIGPGCGDIYTAGIYNYNETLGYGHDDVTIKNLEVKNFCDGIRLAGKFEMDACTHYVENNVIDNCEVHDNGANDKKYHGIDLKPCVRHSTVTNCEVYNNIGMKEGTCEDGGNGIRLHTMSNYNNIINNVVYANSLAGIFSKKKSMHNYVADNDVYENGEFVGGMTDYFGGGIRLQCKKANHWTVENNNVMDNYGPGIYVRGDDNVIRYNQESGSKNASDVASGRAVGVGYGMYFSPLAENNEITENKFCYNEGTNIRNDGTGTIGDENCCDSCYNYKDASATDCCVYCCGSDLVITDIWIEDGKSSIEGKEIEEKELEEFMHEKGMDKEREELKQLIDELGISMEDIDSIDDKCIGRKVYYEVANMGCQEWAGWSVSNLSVDGEFKMIDLVRPLAPKQSRVERFWFYRLPSGEHEVEVCADFLNWVSECNETNNCLTKTLGG